MVTGTFSVLPPAQRKVVSCTDTEPQATADILTQLAMLVTGGLFDGICRWAEVAVALDAPVERLDDERTYQPEVLDTRGAVLSLPEAERGDTDMANLPAYGQVWALGFMYAVETWPETPPSAVIFDCSLPGL